MTKSQQVLGTFFIVAAIPSGMAFSGLSKINHDIDSTENISTVTESQSKVTMTVNTSVGELVIEIPNDNIHKSYIKNLTSLSKEKYYNGQNVLVSEVDYLEFGDPYTKYLNNTQPWGVGGPGYKYPPDDNLKVMQGDYDVALVPLNDGSLHGGLIRIYGKQKRIESISKIGTLINGKALIDRILEKGIRLTINSVSLQ